MTAEDFRGTLDRLGLTQAGLAAEIEALTGHHMAKSTLSRVANGDRSPSPFLVAYLRLREQKGPPD